MNESGMMQALLRTGLLGIAAVLLAYASQAQETPSVLVELTTLHNGSLPQIVTAYGRVEAGVSARQTIMAPTSAVVQSIEVRPGETVAKDAPLLHLTPSPPTAAAYTQAESALQVATDLVTRTRSMVSQHLATAQQLADANKARSDARATVEALKIQGADGPKVLRAPFQSVVTAVATTPGSIVAQGSPLIDLASPQKLVLQVGVIPGEAASIAAGDEVAVTPIDGGPALHGAVSLRGSVVQTTDGLVPVDIAVPVDQLFVGEMAQARITTGRLTGYVVPHGAILVNEQGETYVVQSINMIAKKVPVQILGTDGGQDVIAGPLDPAASLVLTGNHQLNDGMKMRVTEAGSKGTP
ncbi:MAG TPA: HlyD family efflux transporter periplasmic adaptor subunit [Gemmataceae bacterium]|nr:HlyD family efflux transporter periplasmic adaptor subunit [Gemmataceae bacterium]